MAGKVRLEDIAKELNNNLIKCQICSEIQHQIGDDIGERTDVENRIFDTTELL